MKDKPSQPNPVVVTAPGAAATQAEFNVDTAKKQRAINMIWQEGPGGSLSYVPTGTQTEGIPDFKAVTELSEGQQGLYDTTQNISQQYGDIAQKQLGAVGDKLSQPFDMGQFGTAIKAPMISDLGAAPEVNPEVRAQHQQAILDRFSPQLDRNTAALETKLVNQGHARGSQGFNNAMLDDNRARNDFYLGADMQSGQEMANMFGLENQARARDVQEQAQDYTYGTNARDRAIQEEITSRGQPMSELAAFISGAQPKDPRFVGTPTSTVAPTDYLGAEYANAGMQNAFNQNNYNTRMGQYNNQVSGLYGLAGAGAKLAGSTYDYGGTGNGWSWG